MEEAREYGLPRATCFVARRLELVAVAGRLWISWCVLGGADIFRFVKIGFEQLSQSVKTTNVTHTGTDTQTG